MDGGTLGKEREKKQIKPGQGVIRCPAPLGILRPPPPHRRRRRGWAPEEPAQQGLETTIQGAKSCRRGRKRPEAQRKSDSGRAPRRRWRGDCSRVEGPRRSSPPHPKSSEGQTPARP